MNYYNYSKAKSSLISGSFYSTLNHIIKILCGLVSLPLTLNYLGKERYGLWVVTLSALAFTSFLDAGIIPTVKNKMAEAFGENNWAKFKYYSSGAILISGIIIIIGILLSLISLFVDWAHFFNVTDMNSVSEANPLVFVVILVLTTSVALTLIDSIYAAQLQIAITKIYGSVSALISLGMLFLAVNLKVSLPLLALFISSPGLIARLILLLKLRIKDVSLVSPDLSSTKKLFKELLPSSILFMGIQLCTVALSTLPILFIAKYLSLKDVVIFNVAYKFSTIPLFALAAILPVFWPMFTVVWSKQKFVWLRKKIFLLLGLTFISFTVFAAFAFLWGQSIIKFWTGGNAIIPKEILLLMGVWVVIQGLVYWLSTFLHSITDFKFELISYFLAAISLVILLIILAPLHNLIGVITSMILSLFFINFVFMITRTFTKLKASI